MTLHTKFNTTQIQNHYGIVVLGSVQETHRYGERYKTRLSYKKLGFVHVYKNVWSPVSLVMNKYDMYDFS